MTSLFRNLAVEPLDKKHRILKLGSKKHECVNKPKIQTEVAIVTSNIKSLSIQREKAEIEAKNKTQNQKTHFYRTFFKLLWLLKPAFIYELSCESRFWPSFSVNRILLTCLCSIFSQFNSNST